MNSIAKGEYIVGSLLVLLLIFSLIPSIRYAQREARDGIRREALASLKNDLEQYNNKKNVYPIHFDASPYLYIVTEKDGKGALAWYLRTQLENAHSPLAAVDQEAGHNFYYRVVRENNVTFYDICGGTSNCGNAVK